MPDRIVRAGILSSEAVNSLSWEAEVFYRRLHSVADDFGRYDGRITMLRAHLYPLKIDQVTDKQVSKWLAECVAARVIIAYQVDGRPFVEVVKFGQRVRSEKSKWPAPVDGRGHPLTIDSECQQLSALCVDVCVDVDVDVGEKPPSAVPAPKKVKRPQKTALPEGFVISDRVRRWAAEKGHGALEKHFEAFTSKARAKGYTYADWDEALMTAIRDNWAGIAASTRSDTKPVKEALAPSETKEQRDAAWRRQMENYGAPLK